MWTSGPFFSFLFSFLFFLPSTHHFFFLLVRPSFRRPRRTHSQSRWCECSWPSPRLWGWAWVPSPANESHEFLHHSEQIRNKYEINEGSKLGQGELFLRIFYSHGKESLLAPEDAKLTRYDLAAAILLPGRKILSENEANPETSGV